MPEWQSPLSRLTAEGLAHVDLDRPAADILLAFDVIPELAIECDVVGEPLIGVEPHSVIAQRGGDFFGVSHQLRPKAEPLKFWRNRHVFDVQLILLIDRFDQPGEYVAEVQKIEAMVPDGRLVIVPIGLCSRPMTGTHLASAAPG